MSGRQITVGRIVGVHGVKGWVKLLSHTDPIDNLLRYRPWRVALDGVESVLVPVEGRMQGRSLVVRLEGVADRDQALRWVGAEIRIDRSQLPPPRKGEVYWVDLEGLRVKTMEGVLLGTVSHLFATAANDVLVVRGERERMLPFIHDRFVKSVDLGGGEIVVDWDPEF
ncbi:MAG: ribosome maturation factor RimM [Xanthomonadales bacterium]|jgi:16S rRNA processing protein RimM|nr:ribosome maturation factor RimM [Xanthomonadales bacterium]MBK7147026.1 ribosome maturation factor RimM [Xanthomonadales bacterium]MCC6560468.1 ribosome maturation factor RimM [Xanthomonadales bacterium]